MVIILDESCPIKWQRSGNRIAGHQLVFYYCNVVVAGCVLACAGVMLTAWTLVPAPTGSFTPTHSLTTSAPPIWWTMDKDQYSVTRLSLQRLCNASMITY